MLLSDPAVQDSASLFEGCALPVACAVAIVGLVWLLRRLVGSERRRMPPRRGGR